MIHYSKITASSTFNSLYSCFSRTPPSPSLVYTPIQYFQSLIRATPPSFPLLHRISQYLPSKTVLSFGQPQGYRSDSSIFFLADAWLDTKWELARLNYALKQMPDSPRLKRIKEIISAIVAPLLVMLPISFLRENLFIKRSILEREIKILNYLI